MRAVLLMLMVFLMDASWADTPNRMKGHLKRLRHIQSLGANKSYRSDTRRCIALLDYYESLVTKTRKVRIVQSPRLPAVVLIGAQTMTNFPFTKMSTKERFLEFNLMTECRFVYSDLIEGQYYAVNPFEPVVMVARLNQKLDSNRYLIQKYRRFIDSRVVQATGLNELLKLTDTLYVLESKKGFQSDGVIQVPTVANGSESITLQNGFKKQVEKLVHVSPKAIDALYLRAKVLEESLTQLREERVMCGMYVGNSRQYGASQIVKLHCATGKNFDQQRLHKKKKYQLIALD